jgi:shikimate kinase
MPGAGKSTVGVVLAKKLGFHFVDSDLVIQQKEGKLLHELISEQGIDGFLETENRINAELVTEDSVIATGGSVIYGQEAMEHFEQIGVIVYLKLSLRSVARRLGDLQERGVTLREGQDLKALYKERIPYYEKYAHLVINCERKGIRRIVEEIALRYEEMRK